MNSPLWGLGLVLIASLSTLLSFLVKQMMHRNQALPLDEKTHRLKAVKQEDFPMLTSDTQLYLRSIKTLSQQGLRSDESSAMY